MKKAKKTHEPKTNSRLFHGLIIITSILITSVIAILMSRDQNRLSQPDSSFAVGTTRGNWSIISSKNSKDASFLPPPNTSGGTSEQTALLVADLNGDSKLDFVITDRKKVPSIIGYLRNDTGWTRIVIDNSPLNIEAGGATTDIDKDGDIDLVFAGDYQSNAIWWWENPGSNYSNPWTRRVIKQSGKTTHHDAIFGDVNGDGEQELIIWNQGTKAEPDDLLMYKIPADPKSPTLTNWQSTMTRIWQSPPISDQHEGLALADLDNDGVQNIIGGGYWFKFNKNDRTFSARKIDANEPRIEFTRVAVGQLIPGGAPEVVLAHGDLNNASGKIKMYHLTNASTNTWIATDLTPTLTSSLNRGLFNAHSLQIADIDKDGKQDIFVAEMRLQSNSDLNPNSKAWILYGNNSTTFDRYEISTGQDNHESKLADLDNDDDLDILSKPYNYQTPSISIVLNKNTPLNPNKLSLNQWRQVTIGELPARAVFVDAIDLDNDNRKDIVAGSIWFKQSSSGINSTWIRNTIGANFNNFAVAYDFDSDSRIDLLGTKGTGSNSNGSLVLARNLGNGLFSILDITATSRGDFLQGVTPILFKGQLNIALSWHRMPSASKNQIQLLRPASTPNNPNWTLTNTTAQSQNEALSAGDIDGDGLEDLLTGTAWLRNTDSGWERRIIDPNRVSDHNCMIDAAGYTTNRCPDRNKLADINNDGRLDAVVSFESLNNTLGDIIWYEQTTNGWTPHLVAQIRGPLSLDVGDIDNDGDLDIVAGEHSTADSNSQASARVVIFENLDGKGNFSSAITVGSGHDNHDGTILVDLNNDNKLDIVTIGWHHNHVIAYQNLNTNNSSSEDDTTAWWDQRWKGRMRIHVQANGVERRDYPLEVNVNLQDILNKFGGGNPDRTNIRVVEVNTTGSVVNANIPVQLDAVSTSSDILTFLMPGITPASSSRTFYLYVGDTASQNGRTKAQFDDLVTARDVRPFEDAAWEITTKQSQTKWVFEQFGGALISAYDQNNRDWIQFKRYAGTNLNTYGAHYRGVPNLQTYNSGAYTGIFHPGYRYEENTSATSNSPYNGQSNIKVGKLKTTIESTMIVSGSKTNAIGTWHATWTFYPSFVKVLIRPGTDNSRYDQLGFAFLYEGTPGGNLPNESDQVIFSDNSTGRVTSTGISKTLSGPNPWFAITDDNVPNSHWYVRKDEDATSVKRQLYSFTHNNTTNNLTMVGFGRDQTPALRKRPEIFYLGFSNTKDFTALNQQISQVSSDLKVTTSIKAPHEPAPCQPSVPSETGFILPPNTSTQFVMDDIVHEFDGSGGNYNTGFRQRLPFRQGALNPWPNEFRRGTIHERIEVLSKPNNSTVNRPQMCLFQRSGSANGNSLFHFCGRKGNFATTGVFKSEYPVSSFASICPVNGGNTANCGVNWNNPFSDYMLVLKGEDNAPVDPGCNDENCSVRRNPSNRDFNKYYPLKLRTTYVVVAQGAQFSGWVENGTVSPAPACTASPSPSANTKSISPSTPTPSPTQSSPLASITSSPSATPSNTPPNNNLIRNGSFSNSTNWNFYTNGVGEFSTTNNQANVQIKSAGTNNQLFQKDVQLMPNTPYELMFSAKSSKGTDINVYMHNHDAPYTNYGLNYTVDLVPELRTFTIKFTTQNFKSVVKNARLRFWFTSNDTFVLDDVVLKELVSQSNLVKNGSFTNNTDSWSFFTSGAGSLTFDSGVARINLINIADNIQLYQTQIPLAPSQNYVLTFDAKSSDASNLAVAIHKHDPPYTNYGLQPTLTDLTTEWKSFRYPFQSTNNAGNDARLRFWMAGFNKPNTNYYIDNVVLYQEK